MALLAKSYGVDGVSPDFCYTKFRNDSMKPAAELQNNVQSQPEIKAKIVPEMPPQIVPDLPK